MSKKVSVVMSCYNARGTLDRAIQSILAQTYRDFDFIIIDDGSTDDSLDLLKSWSAKDERIKLITNKNNLGLSASLNKGIKAAQGVYIARMDADDWAFEQRLATQVDFLDQHSQVDILGTAVIHVSEEGETIGAAVLPRSHKEIVDRVFKKPLVYHPTVMVRSKVYKTYGLYDTEIRWAEDADLWYRIYDKVGFHNLEEPLLYYTVKSKFRWRHARENIKVKLKNLKRRRLLLRYSPQLAYDVFNYVRKMIL